MLYKSDTALATQEKREGSLQLPPGSFISARNKYFYSLILQIYIFLPVINTIFCRITPLRWYLRFEQISKDYSLYNEGLYNFPVYFLYEFLIFFNISTCCHSLGTFIVYFQCLKICPGRVMITQVHVLWRHLLELAFLQPHLIH